MGKASEIRKWVFVMWNNKKRPSFLSKIKSVLQGFSKQADSSKPSFISFVRRAPRRTIFGAVFTLILLIGGAAAFRLTQAPQDIRQQAEELNWHLQYSDFSDSECKNLIKFNEGCHYRDWSSEIGMCIKYPDRNIYYKVQSSVYDPDWCSANDWTDDGGTTGKYNAMVYRRSDGVRYTSGLTMKSSTGSVGIVGDHFDISNALTGAHWLSLTPNPINSNIDCLYVDWRVFQHSNPDVSVASGKGCVANFDFPGGDWLYGVNFAVNTSIQFDTGEGDLYCKLDIVDATILNDGIVAKNSLITFNCRPDSTRPFVQFQIRKPGNTNWDSPVWSNPPGSFKYSYTFSQIGNYGVRCRTCAYNNDENSCGAWKEAAQPTWTPPPP